VSQIIRDRLKELPEPIRNVAWKAQVRLSARYRKLIAAGKPAPKVSSWRSPASWSVLSGRLHGWSNPSSPGSNDGCCDAWNWLLAQTGRIRSLCSYPWLSRVSD